MNKQKLTQDANINKTLHEEKERVGKKLDDSIAIIKVRASLLDVRVLKNCICFYFAIWFEHQCVVLELDLSAL